MKEYTLVVKRLHIFSHGIWHGFKETDFSIYQSIINEKKEFHPRHLMEKDPSYKQIIPYLLFSHEDKFFLMQRSSDARATHLRNKLSLGIGGHICPEDVTQESIFSWAHREFHEEVNYAGNVTVIELGIVNDDSYEQGTMHMGFVFLLKGDSPDISIKSELKSGRLVALEECIQQKENMEAWSKHIIEFLEAIKI